MNKFIRSKEGGNSAPAGTWIGRFDSLFFTIPAYTDLFSSTAPFLFHAFTLLLPLVF